MIEEVDDARLDAIFEALANPHRRDMVRFLGLQPAAISELARQRNLSLPAMNKHIAILERAGLVQRRKIGRTTYLTLRRQPLASLMTWTEQFHPHWGHDDATYDNYLDHIVRTGTPPPTTRSANKKGNTR